MFRFQRDVYYGDCVRFVNLSRGRPDAIVTLTAVARQPVFPLVLERGDAVAGEQVMQRVVALVEPRLTPALPLAADPLLWHRE